MVIHQHKRTLQLNQDFTAHSLLDWKEAISAVADNAANPSEGAFMVDFYHDEEVLDSKGRHYIVPAVIALAKYVKPGGVAFSRYNVFIRDKLKCQYCGTKHHPWELTFDHVIPRSKWDKEKYGTPTHWTNIVTCCKPCNAKKGDKTLKESGMKLLKQPFIPAGANFIHGLKPWMKIEEQWKPYLPALYINGGKL